MKKKKGQERKKMDRKKLTKALKTLKEECLGHMMCRGCPFHKDGGNCTLLSCEPYQWSENMMKEETSHA